MMQNNQAGNSKKIDLIEDTLPNESNILLYIILVILKRPFILILSVLIVTVPLLVYLLNVKHTV